MSYNQGGDFSTIPKSLQLDDMKITFKKFYSKKGRSIFYNDIETIEFQDFWIKVYIANYYLVFKTVSGKKMKLPFKSLVKNLKDQEKIVNFILSKNPNIKFRYRLGQYNEWVAISN